MDSSEETAKQDSPEEEEYNITYLETIVALVNRLDDDLRKFYPTKIYQALRNYLVKDEGSESLEMLLKEIIIQGVNPRPRLLFRELKVLGEMYYNSFQKYENQEEKEKELVKQFYISCKNIDDRIRYVQYLLEDRQLLQKSEEVHDLLNQISSDIESLQGYTHETSATIMKSKNVSKIERRMNLMQSDLIRMIDSMNQLKH